MAPRVIVLSTADFQSPVWTNKQYLAVGLCETMDVVYIESMGLRSPKFNRSDISRIWGKVFKSVNSQQREDISDKYARLEVVSPKVLPFHGSRIAAWINKKLIAKTIVSEINPKPDDVLWTFSPLTYGLENYFAKVVYHSVDLLHTLPGTPTAVLLSAEENLARQADVVIASSAGVCSHLNAIGVRDVQLWENVADVETFKHSQVELRENRAVFAGNLTSTKVDFELLRRVAESGVSLTLAGPVSIDGVESDQELQELLGHSNVNYLGNLSLQELARECGRSMVGLIPYLRNDYTTGVFPLKIYEYLAAGMQVVCTPITSVVHGAPKGVSLGDGDEFIRLTHDALASFTKESARERTDFAQDHSWSNRIVQARNLVGELTR
ncbi:hypothetical protein CJ178_13170 [Rhodococcus sp. ACPA4]|uniref:glycosyltransferase n=1 Tax=Rhodococcus sp. ACPA4 TaxID=2028571 RepID=UPI000BB1355A|nr:glycosyltransferase [Rhodococcus sp. ACPA4]PBC42413.1 hypothetical protein CJ178_13170 [Rhodococcus sp. ACPA4]